MSKRFNLFWAALLMLQLVVWGDPPDSLWSRTYGGTGDEVARFMIQTSDGGFALVGGTESFGAGNTDVWMVKIDANGDSLQSRTYGEEDYENAVSLIQTTDNGFVILGFKWRNGAEQIWLIKTDSAGNEEWNRVFDDEHDNKPYSIIQTSDGGFAILATAFLFNGDYFSNYIWLIKTDSAGNEEWSRTYGGGEYDRCYDLIQTLEGDFVLAGSHTFFQLEGGGEFSHLAIYKIDEDGDEIWMRDYYYGGYSGDIVDIDRAFTIIETEDGGYAVGGTTINGDIRNPWFIKTDENGDSLWSVWSDEAGIVRSIVETEYNSFVIAAGSQPSMQSLEDQLVLLEVSEGKLLWVRDYGGGLGVRPCSIVKLDDGFAVGGGSGPLFRNDFWFLRLGEIESVSFSRNHLAQFKITSAYPNPFNSSTRITFNLPKSEFVDFTVYNSIGQAVQGFSGICQPGNNKVVFNAANLPSGVYFARIESSQFNQAQRLYLVK